MATLKTIFQVSHPTIMNWFNGWQTNGIRGLMNHPGQGRKAILSPDDQPLIKTKLQAAPQQLRRVREELKAELNKEFSTKTLTRYLPAYGPHLNRIERLWRESKYQWIPPQAYANLATLSQSLETIWSRFGTDYKIHFLDKKS